MKIVSWLLDIKYNIISNIIYLYSCVLFVSKGKMNVNARYYSHNLIDMRPSENQRPGIYTQFSFFSVAIYFNIPFMLGI